MMELGASRVSSLDLYQAGTAPGWKVTLSLDVQRWASNLLLTLGPDYYSGFGRQLFPVDGILLTDYLQSPPRSDGAMCPEMALPARFLSDVEVRVEEGEVWGGTARAHVHAGQTECFSPLHFDWDFQWVMHVCLSGRKRFFFFPPMAGWLLNPVVNVSAICVPKLSESDRGDLLRRLDGQEVVLQPGEGVLFPSTYWHGVLYEEPSAAVSVRFEVAPGGRPFAVLPRSWLLQRVCWRFLRAGYGEEASKFVKRCAAEFFTPGLDWRERWRRMNRLYGDGLLRLGDDAGAGVWVGEQFSSELALAGEELEWYYSVDDTALSDAQRAEVADAEAFLFEGLSLRPEPWMESLARHAVLKRQGLRPRRGVIPLLKKS